MGVDRALRDLIADIDQLSKLYRQLSNVPQQVQQLFTDLANARQLLCLSITQLAATTLEIDPSHDFFTGKPFSRFRATLLDLELFLDPHYQLHQSGPQSEIRNAIPWVVRDDEQTHATCEAFQHHLVRLERDCQDFFSLLQASPRARSSVEHAVSQAPSPVLAPSEYSIDSGTSTPSSSRRSSTTRVPDHLKSEEQRIFDRFLAQYSGSIIAGSKRKRPSRERRKRPEEPTDTLAAISKFLPHPIPSPNVDFAISASPSPRLFPLLNGSHPPWVFDDIRNSLPTLPGAQPAPAYEKGRGKQPIQPALDDAGPAGVGSDSSNSSGSFRSMASREGSIFTVASRDRAFEEGTTKVWFRKGSQLQILPIQHIEVRRLDRIRGEGIVVVSKTPSGQDVLDDLWMPSLGTNSCPFLENAEVASTFQRRDKSANFVVCFAPHPEHHPQYSFSSRDDCWDFMQAIADKSLCASLDVESIKSACTHGHAAEGGCATIQVWEDDALGLKTIKLFRNKNELAKQKVIDINVNCLRMPKKEKGTGKLVVDFRDSKDGFTSEMKYLKIGFSNADAEEGFLCQVGFRSLLS
ncbi:hypothetical protein E2P81_ATG01320 [Venturia nashicola]|uniref:Uncharacterized protein n=1 Tax=Venturia nashicola TaxID=86259 RepID=A0A4Z1PBV3_9PEZI|nr:hypothetical protein E6O75_ATG01351 [Venturia nashicola]TLD38777.1 hypothetical protein E2P81_ATG01320 [Venturia nashicola]